MFRPCVWRRSVFSSCTPTLCSPLFLWWMDAFLWKTVSSLSASSPAQRGSLWWSWPSTLEPSMVTFQSDHTCRFTFRLHCAILFYIYLFIFSLTTTVKLNVHCFTWLIFLSPPHLLSSVSPAVSRITLSAWPTRRKACWPALIWCCRALKAQSTRQQKNGGSQPSPWNGYWSLLGLARGQRRSVFWSTCRHHQVRKMSWFTNI